MTSAWDGLLDETSTGLKIQDRLLALLSSSALTLGT